MILKLLKSHPKYPSDSIFLTFFLTTHRNETMKPIINETRKWTYRYKILKQNRKEKEGCQSIGKINHES